MSIGNWESVIDLCAQLLNPNSPPAYRLQPIASFIIPDELHALDAGWNKIALPDVLPSESTNAYVETLL